MVLSAAGPLFAMLLGGPSGGAFRAAVPLGRALGGSVAMGGALGGPFGTLGRFPSTGRAPGRPTPLGRTLSPMGRALPLLSGHVSLAFFGRGFRGRLCVLLMGAGAGLAGARRPTRLLLRCTLPRLVSGLLVLSLDSALALIRSLLSVRPLARGVALLLRVAASRALAPVLLAALVSVVLLRAGGALALRAFSQVVSVTRVVFFLAPVVVFHLSLELVLVLVDHLLWEFLVVGRDDLGDERGPRAGVLARHRVVHLALVAEVRVERPLRGSGHYIIERTAFSRAAGKSAAEIIVRGF